MRKQNERFGDQVLRYSRRFRFSRAILSHEGSLKALPPASQAVARAWIVDVASGWAAESLWLQDAKVARSDWRQSASRMLAVEGKQPTAEDVENAIDSLLMYLAADLARFPERKRVVQNVLGVGFWGRLFG